MTYNTSKPVSFLLKNPGFYLHKNCPYQSPHKTTPRKTQKQRNFCFKATLETLWPCRTQLFESLICKGARGALLKVPLKCLPAGSVCSGWFTGCKGNHSHCPQRLLSHLFTLLFIPMHICHTWTWQGHVCVKCCVSCGLYIFAQLNRLRMYIPLNSGQTANVNHIPTPGGLSLWDFTRLFTFAWQKEACGGGQWWVHV